MLRRGCLDKAEILTCKISKEIATVKANLLRRASTKDTKQLWQMLHKTNNWPNGKRGQFNSSSTDLSADDLNSYFAGIATDPGYSATAIADAILSAESQLSQDTSGKFFPYSDGFFAQVLHNVRNTASGPDGIPSWVYKTFACPLGSVVSKLVNYSISTSCAPTAWHHAQVTPIPKTAPISGPSDFRPISVTSLLSHLTERIIVRHFLLPCLKPELFSDQYAYKPTGSTTCALIDFAYRVHTMLETNQYVRCVFTDFSKAFDMVDHVILVQKLTAL